LRGVDTKEEMLLTEYRPTETWIDYKSAGSHRQMEECSEEEGDQMEEDLSQLPSDAEESTTGKLNAPDRSVWSTLQLKARHYFHLEWLRFKSRCTALIGMQLIMIFQSSPNPTALCLSSFSILWTVKRLGFREPEALP
jgi:hypothetical protein